MEILRQNVVNIPNMIFHENSSNRPVKLFHVDGQTNRQTLFLCREVSLEVNTEKAKCIFV